ASSSQTRVRGDGLLGRCSRRTDSGIGEITGTSSSSSSSSSTIVERGVTSPSNMLSQQSSAASMEAKKLGIRVEVAESVFLVQKLRRNPGVLGGRFWTFSPRRPGGGTTPFRGMTEHPDALRAGHQTAPQSDKVTLIFMTGLV